MSHTLPPCDHDECPPTRCKAKGELAPATGSDNRLSPLWTPSDKWLPPDPEPVLATDQGTHYVAYWNGEEWCDVYSDDVIDCHITHWMWLPDFPEE